GRVMVASRRCEQVASYSTPPRLAVPVSAAQISLHRGLRGRPIRRLAVQVLRHSRGEECAVWIGAVSICPSAIPRSFGVSNGGRHAPTDRAAFSDATRYGGRDRSRIVADWLGGSSTGAGKAKLRAKAAAVRPEIHQRPV